MAVISGAKLTMDANSQSNKAYELEAIVDSIVSKIQEIDEEILTLVQGGMEGSAVETMSRTYIQNREVINDYVKRFASIACVLDDDAQRMKKINENSEVSAGGR